jgi:hypothetical protein
MSACEVVARVLYKEVLIGGEHHAGWLPADASTPLPVPTRRLQFSFEIQFDGDGYLLCYASKNGEFDSDTWHKTLEEAKEVANQRFDIHPSEWLVPLTTPTDGPAAPARR